jgi:hypothetical protein
MFHVNFNSIKCGDNLKLFALKRDRIWNFLHAYQSLKLCILAGDNAVIEFLGPHFVVLTSRFAILCVHFQFATNAQTIAAYR